MSVKSIKTVRESKPFRPADLIVYGVLAAVIVGLFIAFVFTRTAAPLIELYVDADGSRVLVWSQSENAVAITADWQSRVDAERSDDTLKVTVWQDEAHAKYNVIVFTADGAKMTEANCSAHKDCVHTAKIIDSSGVIVCVPHRLKIYSSGERNPSLG